jgi:hypothetical protein
VPRPSSSRGSHPTPSCSKHQQATQPPHTHRQLHSQDCFPSCPPCKLRPTPSLPPSWPWARAAWCVGADTQGAGCACGAARRRWGGSLNPGHEGRSSHGMRDKQLGSRSRPVQRPAHVTRQGHRRHGQGKRASAHDPPVLISTIDLDGGFCLVMCVSFKRCIAFKRFIGGLMRKCLFRLRLRPA